LTRDSLVAVALALACPCLPSCDKGRDAPVEATGAPSSHPGDAAAAGARAAAGASASSAAATVAWRGSYQSVAGALYIPADWKDVHWRVKESDTGLGAGTIAMHVDPATGRVLGVLDGSLGPAAFDGLLSDGRLTATISRRDPADEGFMGTMVGSLARDRAEGTMNVSLAQAGAIRTATFTMAPEGAKATPP
jgi:hypothetical protein